MKKKIKKNTSAASKARAKNKTTTAGSEPKHQTAAKKKKPRTGAPLAQSQLSAAVTGKAENSSAPALTRGEKIKKKAWWPKAIIAGIIVLVSVEFFVLVKEKINRQAELRIIRTLGTRGSPPDVTGKFWAPGRIRVDEKYKRVCIIDPSFFKIVFWDIRSDKHIIDIDKEGRHQIEPPGQPRKKGFVPGDGGFDGKGNLYVVDLEKPEVCIFSPDYQLKAAWATVYAKNIAVTSDGQFYLSDLNTKEIVHYNSAGQEINRFGIDLLSNPRFMTTDEKGRLYVVDCGLKKVMIFSSHGKLLHRFAPRFQPFGNPDIAVRKDKIYVSEPENRRIFVFAAMGKKMVKDLTAYWPAVIDVDANGFLYIAGSGGIDKGRIVKPRQ